MLREQPIAAGAVVLGRRASRPRLRSSFPMGPLGAIWVVVRLMFPFVGSLIYFGTQYLGDPKGDHSFDNHPHGTYLRLKGGSYVLTLGLNFVL